MPKDPQKEQERAAENFDPRDLPTTADFDEVDATEQPDDVDELDTVFEELTLEPPNPAPVPYLHPFKLEYVGHDYTLGFFGKRRGTRLGLVAHTRWRPRRRGGGRSSRTRCHRRPQ